VWQHQKFGKKKEKKKQPGTQEWAYYPKYLYVYVKYKYLDIVAKP